MENALGAPWALSLTFLYDILVKRLWKMLLQCLAKFFDFSYRIGHNYEWELLF